MSHITYIHIYPETKRFLKHIKKIYQIITCLDSCVYFFHVDTTPSCWCVLNHDCQALASVFVGNSKTKRKNNAASNGFLLLNYWKVSILRKWSTLHLPYAHVAHSNFKAPFFRAATDTNRGLFGSGAPDLAQANLQEFQRRQKFTYT